MWTHWNFSRPGKPRRSALQYCPFCMGLQRFPVLGSLPLYPYYFVIPKHYCADGRKHRYYLNTTLEWYCPATTVLVLVGTVLHCQSVLSLFGTVINVKKTLEVLHRWISKALLDVFKNSIRSIFTVAKAIAKAAVAMPRMLLSQWQREVHQASKASARMFDGLWVVIGSYLTILCCPSSLFG